MHAGEPKRTREEDGDDTRERIADTDVIFEHPGKYCTKRNERGDGCEESNRAPENAVGNAEASGEPGDGIGCGLTTGYAHYGNRKTKVE